MTFEKALEAMKQGKKVRRKIYSAYEYWFYNSDFDRVIVYDGENYRDFGVKPVHDMIESCKGDWEIHEESLKEPEMTAEHAIEALERDSEPEHKCNACHCNCSHTGTDTNLQEEMKQALSRKFFELEKYSDDESTVNCMLNIYSSIFSD